MLYHSYTHTQQNCLHKNQEQNDTKVTSLCCKQNTVISAVYFLCHVVPPAHSTQGPALTEKNLFPQVRTRLT